MNIAFLSFEFPEETGGGGIGTYLQSFTRLLLQNGHTYTVFCGTAKDKPFWESESVMRIPSSGWVDFNQKVTQPFIDQHRLNPFDVAECTDFRGCGLFIKKQLPGLPVVVRLHTPNFMVDQLLFHPLPFYRKVRFALSGLAKGQWPRIPGPPKSNNYKEEFELIRLAERISSPSYSISSEMKVLGFDLENKTDIVPLPFEISPELNQIKCRASILNDPRIVFIGRLEKRKGVIELARAIPKVIKCYSKAHFTFLGDSASSPVPGLDMQSFLRKMLKQHKGSVHFTGKLPYKEVFSYLAYGDIFVFPSHYESFGLACCEAMAAGKAVIASEKGGMAEIIENERSGLVVAPKNHDSLAKAIIRVAGDNQLRLRLGESAAKRIERYLDPSRLAKEQMDCYRKAIFMQTL